MSVPYFDSELSDDALTDHVRVLQRRRGHRYSIDDVITARLAIEARPQARSYLDLGCGIGSVLLMVADRLPEVQAAGIEAQIESYALAERNVQRNALAGRVRVHQGDLRDGALLERVRALSPTAAAGFDLITGTPPYKPLGTASISPDPQRAHARIELRGGVEVYLHAAAGLLADDGCFVMCAEAALEPRVFAALGTTGLQIERCLDVVAREGKGTLFSVYTFGFAANGGERSRTGLALASEGGPSRADSAQHHRLAEAGRSRDDSAHRPLAAGSEPAARETGRSSALSAGERLVLRDAQGARTPAANGLRAFFGMPARPDELPSPPLRPRHEPVR